MRLVSVVMTAYKRANLLVETLRSIRNQVFIGEVIVVEDGYDGGYTETVCRAHGAKWICRKDRPDIPYSNQAVPLNMGIEAATGEIIILQNAECVHVGKVIAPLVESVAPKTAVFARCISLNKDGSHGQDYCSTNNPRPFFFCGAFLKEGFPRFDEGYAGYGYEDEDMARQLEQMGYTFLWCDDFVVHHQWHPSLWHGDKLGAEMEAANRERYRQKWLQKT